MGRKKRHRGADRPPAAAPKTGWVRGIAALAVVGGAVALALMSWRSDPGPTTRSPSAGGALPAAPPPTATPGPRAATPPPAAAASAPAELRPLLGEWRRPDGGYVLAVTGIAEDGTATAGYLNPQPINVGRAEARRDEKGVLHLFVELRDRNYPGSTYTLVYDPEGDQLVGVYFQAVQRASYDVVFVRRR